MDNATQEFENRLGEVDAIKSVQNETRTLRENVKSEIWRIREKLNRVKRLASNVSLHEIAGLDCYAIKLLVLCV